MNIKITQIEPLSIVVHESISVSDAIVVLELFIYRITTSRAKESNGLVVSVAEYRKLLGDYQSTDERITDRLRYLEAFCRNIIKPEIKTYVVTKSGAHQAST